MIGQRRIETGVRGIPIILERHIVRLYERGHLLDEIRIVAAAESVAPRHDAPLAEPDGLAFRGRETHEPVEPEGFALEVAPARCVIRDGRVAGAPILVINVFGDVIDVSVSGIAFRRTYLALADIWVPDDLEIFARDRAQHVHDILKGRDEGGRSGGTWGPGIPTSVEFPAETDERIRLAIRDERLRDLEVVAVELARRDFGQRRSTVGHVERHAPDHRLAGQLRCPLTDQPLALGDEIRPARVAEVTQRIFGRSAEPRGECGDRRWGARQVDAEPRLGRDNR